VRWQRPQEPLPPQSGLFFSVSYAGQSIFYDKDTNFCVVEQLFAQKSKKNRNFAPNFCRK